MTDANYYNQLHTSFGQEAVLPKDVPSNIETPHLIFTFRREYNDLVRLSVYDLVVGLYQNTGVELHPKSYGIGADDTFRMSLECQNTCDINNGYDLRNLFQGSEYKSMFEKCGVASIDFKNFPLPFKPVPPRTVQYNL